jgi:hypothetical protein
MQMMTLPKSAPALLLRPGLQEKRIITRANGLFQGFHVSASLPGPMTAMLRESGKPSMVDPHTYLFTLRPKRLLKPDTTALRPSVASLAQGYGAPFDAAAGTRPLTPIDFAQSASARACVERICSHQRNRSRVALKARSPRATYRA